jgi:hypothetical protein
MSQFLWVEDFAGPTLRDTTVGVFGELLKNQQIPETKREVKQLLKKQGVFVELSFLDGLVFIRDPKKLLQVDYIILDIWLDINIKPDKKRLPKLLQEYYGYEPQPDDEIADENSFNKAKAELLEVAGYQLYVELVMDHGFPKEHILFCSDHADEQKSIQRKFKQAKIEFPRLYSKNNKKQVQAWVRERRKNPYSVLRRGILNVLDHLESNNHSLTLPFAEEADPVNAATFLKGLNLLLKDAVKEPPQQDQGYLFLTLCDYLTKPFERFTRELFNGRYKGQNLNRIQMDQAFIIPAYFIRNWVAHGLLTHSETQSAQDIAFIFILVINSMFNYPDLKKGLKAFKSLYSAQAMAEQDLIRLLYDMLHEYYNFPEKCDIF